MKKIISGFLSDIGFLLRINSEKPTTPPPEKISDYVHKKRKMPLGSPRPGPMDIHLTPYTIEIMDCMSPYSGINRVSIMKGVQIALTTAAENVIAYFMDACPAEIIYCTATDSLLKKWRKRLEALINSCGFRRKISAQETNKGSRATGDTTNSKEYPGGSLSMTSLQSPAGQRSESNRVLVVDEADGAPATLTTGEGAYLGTLEGRTVAYGSKYKIMELSTPGTKDDSVIYPQFLEGDQRYYNVPCPRCGDMIVLEFEQLRPVYDDHGRLESVYYECQSCKGKIDNGEKTEMMKVGNGVWVPTAVPRDPSHRSYHISAMYSPVGMLSWHRIYDFYLKSEENPDRKPSFNNLYKGLPFKEEGHRPDISKKIRLRGEYKDGTVPHGAIYLTMASDVQRGKVKYQEMSPEELTDEIARMREQGVDLWKQGLPRIETEVYGVGRAYRSWSVDYKIFYGHTTMSAHEGAFERMYEWMEKTKLEYRRADGLVFAPMISLMDASDGVTQAAVMMFCDRVGLNMYPNINEGWLKRKKDPGVDEETHRNFDRYRLSRKGKGGPEYCLISTNYYKKIIYQRIAIERTQDDSKQNPPAFCDFPVDRADHYFKMLTNEEQMNDGSFANGGRPVESLDCRCYNLAAADIWLDMKVKKARENAEKAGYNPADVEKHDKKWVLTQIERELFKYKMVG